MKNMSIAPIYFDYNATTPCADEVVTAMLPFFNVVYGNAASINNQHGILAQQAVEEARQKIAQLVGIDSDELIFTSGATESNNLALRGAFSANRRRGDHIITSSIEHPSVLATLRELESEGAQVTYLEPERDGTLDVNKLAAAITDKTILISIMYANNELGVINPIAEIGDIAHENGIIFMCDATQAVGKVWMDVSSLPIDILSFSAHKLYGPKGIGALCIRRTAGAFAVPLKKQISGGYGEFGLRSGTLNVPGIVGFGKAAELAMAALNGSEPARVTGLRDRFEQRLMLIAKVHFNGKVPARLPHVSSVTFENINHKVFLERLTESLSVSTSSACSTGSAAGSHVLRAIGLDDQRAKSTIRFSFGKPTQDREIEFAINLIEVLYAEALDVA